jgi:hypothetical protein
VTPSAFDQGVPVAAGIQSVPAVDAPAYDVATPSTPSAPDTQPFNADPLDNQAQPIMKLPIVEDTQIFPVERGVVYVVQRIRVRTASLLLPSFPCC